MTYQIKQTPYTAEIKQCIDGWFSTHAIHATGIDGYAEDLISFTLYEPNNENFIGCLVIYPFWGQMHIKYFVVSENHRDKGYGQILMNHALDYAKQREFSTAFVETMSFQAPAFYIKNGFKINHISVPFAKGVRHYYLSKDLNQNVENSCDLSRLMQGDGQLISQAFHQSGWSKPEALFEGYYQDQLNDQRVCWVARCDDQIAGYVTLKWQSFYEPFAAQGIPEIMDLNVLPSFRHRGIGSSLIRVAETEASKKADHVGLGVGLYAGQDGGYGSAQKLYVKLGYVPDGRGVTYAYAPVVPGTPHPVDDDLVLWFTKWIK